MAFNTGNPIGSTDARDLSDNAENFDVLLNSADDTYQDRLGNTVPTAAGAIKRLGPVVTAWTFTTGGTLNYPNEAALNPADGNWYGWTGTFPHVVAPGTDPTAVTGYVPRTDVVLRNDLAGVDGAALIGMATYAQIRAYTGTSTRINCLGRANLFDGAGGLFAVDTADTITADDDGYCLVDTTGRRWKRVGFAAIDPCWFGAVSDYNSTTKAGTSSSTAFFKAISLAAAGVTTDWPSGVTYSEICKTVRPRTGNYKFTASVPIPSGVTVDLNGSMIGGDGFTDSDIDAFVTGYIDVDGVLKSNLALAPNVGIVTGAKLINWRAINLRRFFNAKNWNENSVCSLGYAYNVRQAVKAVHSFYGTVNKSTSRGSAGSSPLAAWEFDSFVNIMDIDGLVSTDRGQAELISGGVNGLHIRNQSYETGQNGLKLSNEVYPAFISSNYFEGLAGVGLDMFDSATKRNVVIDNNWFFEIGQIGIYAQNMQGGKIGSGNYFHPTVAVNVHVNDVYSTVTTEITPARTANAVDTRPSFPASKYVLGNAVDVKYRVHIFEASTGATVATQNYADSRPIDFSYSGKQGFASGNVAFCYHSKTDGTSFSVIVDTKINYDDYIMCGFSLNISDGVASFKVCGRVYGTSVVTDVNAGSKTITASNNGGYLRLVVGTFSHPSEVYSCEGIVRHL